MNRQNTRACRVARLACTFCLALLFAAGDSQAADAPAVRLRLEWGGGNAEVWGGVFELSQGRFAKPLSLGLEADEPGTLWLDEGALWLQRRTPRVFDGFDVTVVAPPTAMLRLTFQAAGGNPAREPIEVRVGDLYSRQFVTPLGQADRRLVIRRAPGDTLPVEIERSHLVYAPGERFRAAVALNLLESRTKSVPATLNWKLVTHRGARSVAHGSTTVQAATNASHPAQVHLDFDLPQEEGVYQLRISTHGKGTDSLERSIQLAVIAEAAPERRSGAAAERLVDDFDPAAPGMFRRISSSSTLKKHEGVDRLLHMHNARDESRSHAAGSAETSWSAYRLKIEKLDRPHRLVVKLPARLAQHVGVSIIQPNSAGQVVPAGIDSGIIVGAGSPEPSTGSGAGHSTASIEHRILFWPRVREPVLLLYNLKSMQPVVVNKVEVFELGEQLTAAPRTEAALPDRRLVGLYLQKPLLPENFGAPEAFDAGSQRSVDDWNTFYTAGRRLVEYLQHHDYNALLLGVLADGSTIYPSALLEPSPRFDTGILDSAGQDPVRKDVLELWLRLFDRDGLTLVPELQFSTPLPALERLLTDGGAVSEGIQLVGRDGRTWTETYGATRGLAPYYNPLDPRVQQAILDVVLELVQRYQQHPSLRGLALELGQHGYLQLPGIEWGYDPQTVQRFEQATGIRVPVANEAGAPAQRYEFLTTKVEREWSRWRCAELTKFHVQLVRAVTAIRPDLFVFLSGQRLLGASGTDEHVQQTVRAGGGLEQLLPSQGLDASLYAGEPRLGVLRPILQGASERLLGSAMTETLNSHPVLDNACRSAHRGCLLYTAPWEHRIPEFDAVSPWQPTQTWLIAHVSSMGTEQRKHWAHSLAALDSQSTFIGGWMIPLGQEEETRDIRRAIAELPAVRFQTGGPQPQPVVIRTANADDQTYLYVVNDSGMPLRLELRLSCPANTPCRRLGRDQRTLLRNAGTGQSQIELSLGAYGVCCFRLGVPRADVLSARVLLADDDLATLRGRVDRLHELMAGMENAGKINGTPLANPGFELASASEQDLPGWELPVQNADWSLDLENPHSGKTALKLVCKQRDVALVSPEFSLEGARMLATTLWMRSDQPSTTVQLVLEAELEGRLHRQFASVQVTREWQRYLFRVRHLPEGKLEHAQVKIEPEDDCQLWIDDVEIRAQRLSPEDVRQLTKTMAAVNLAWEERRYADCQRLLDGYWGQLLIEQQGQPVARTAAAPEPRPAAAQQRRKLFPRR